MNKIIHYLYHKLFFNKKKHKTEIKLVFDINNNDPNLILNLTDLEYRTAEELAKIFHILQNGSIQKILVEKITDIAANYDPLFLENVYNNYSRLTPPKIIKKNLPVIRPLAVFNILKNDQK